MKSTKIDDYLDGTIIMSILFVDQNNVLKAHDNLFLLVNGFCIYKFIKFKATDNM